MDNTHSEITFIIGLGFLFGDDEDNNAYKQK